jgi:hypothetical protein
LAAVFLLSVLAGAAVMFLDLPWWGAPVALVAVLLMLLAAVVMLERCCPR